MEINNLIIRVMIIAVLLSMCLVIIGCDEQPAESDEVETGDKVDEPIQPITTECVPAECCHATSCVLKENMPDCGMTMCTMDCRPGTMDCGQGHCELQEDECVVVWS